MFDRRRVLYAPDPMKASGDQLRQDGASETIRHPPGGEFLVDLASSAISVEASAICEAT